LPVVACDASRKEKNGMPPKKQKLTHAKAAMPRTTRSCATPDDEPAPEPPRNTRASRKACSTALTQHAVPACTLLLRSLVASHNCTCTLAGGRGKGGGKGARALRGEGGHKDDRQILPPRRECQCSCPACGPCLRLFVVAVPLCSQNAFTPRGENPHEPGRIFLFEPVSLRAHEAHAPACKPCPCAHLLAGRRPDQEVRHQRHPGRPDRPLGHAWPTCRPRRVSRVRPPEGEDQRRGLLH
jgi:hypothetical protein